MLFRHFASAELPRVTVYPAFKTELSRTGSAQEGGELNACLRPYTLKGIATFWDLTRK